MKKLIFLITITFSILVSFTAYAGPFGLGVILFGPTGLSSNFQLDQNHSIDSALAWSLNDDDQNFYLHATYLWNYKGLLKIDKIQLDHYWGVGGRVISWDNPPGKDRDPETRVGLRGAAGIDYTFRPPNIEVFGELSLTMDVIPETDADLALGIGARYYF